MSYDILMQKFPRLKEKLEAVQTLSNMGLVESDNFHLEKMASSYGSNNFARKNEKWLQTQIEKALSNTEYNLVITNLRIYSLDKSHTNVFMNLFKNMGVKRVLQFSRDGYALLVEEPGVLAKELNKKEHEGRPIRVYELKKPSKKIVLLGQQYYLLCWVLFLHFFADSDRVIISRVSYILCYQYQSLAFLLDTLPLQKIIISFRYYISRNFL